MLSDSLYVYTYECIGMLRPVVCVQDVWMDEITAHALDTGEWPPGFDAHGTLYAAAE
jgi:hypothetical protein